MHSAPIVPRLLLVEGRTDCHVVKHICERHAPMPEFQIKVANGIDPLLKSIRAEAQAADRYALGIMVDANTNLDSRWQAVTNQLRRANIDPPRRPEQDGLVLVGDHHPRIGIWLMPDNGTAGAIEDFVKRMIPASDAVWPLAQEFIAAIPDDARAFKPQKALRAEIHAWLSTRSEPRLMAAAIRANDLDVQGQNCMAFVQWLQCLFQ